MENTKEAKSLLSRITKLRKKLYKYTQDASYYYNKSDTWKYFLVLMNGEKVSHNLRKLQKYYLKKNLFLSLRFYTF